MWNQVVVALLVFQGYYWAVDLIAHGSLEEPSLLLFNFVFSAWLSMEAFRVRLGHSDASRTFGFASRMFLIASFLSVALAIFDISGAGGAASLPLPPVAFVPGVLLVALGIYLRHTAIKTLGRFFVTKVQITDGHQLVKAGIYGFLRHPSYTGLIVGFGGSVLMTGSGLALLCFIGFALPAYFYRIWVEEKALISVFGEDYLQYRAETYALIPYLY